MLFASNRNLCELAWAKGQIIKMQSYFTKSVLDSVPQKMKPEAIAYVLLLNWSMQA